jgi:hypothetical protein
MHEVIGVAFSIAARLMCKGYSGARLSISCGETHRSDDRDAHESHGAANRAPTDP